MGPLSSPSTSLGPMPLTEHLLCLRIQDSICICFHTKGHRLFCRLAFQLLYTALWLSFHIYLKQLIKTHCLNKPFLIVFYSPHYRRFVAVWETFERWERAGVSEDALAPSVLVAKSRGDQAWGMQQLWKESKVAALWPDDSRFWILARYDCEGQSASGEICSTFTS